MYLKYDLQQFIIFTVFVSESLGISLKKKKKSCIKFWQESYSINKALFLISKQ